MGQAIHLAQAHLPRLYMLRLLLGWGRCRWQVLGCAPQTPQLLSANILSSNGSISTLQCFHLSRCLGLHEYRQMS